MLKKIDSFSTCKPLICKNLYQLKYYLFVLTFYLGIISLNVVAAPADLDPTFGTLGKVVSNPDGTATNQGNDFALQADGKIVMVGYSGISDEIPSYVVVRYNSDGSLDDTFGTDGVVLGEFNSVDVRNLTVAIQSDGKIVIGLIVAVSRILPTDFGIVRLNTDGSIDKTFGEDGAMTVPFDGLPNSLQEELESVKILDDGKIMLAGTARLFPAPSRLIFARLNSDGSLDKTFGTAGKMVAREYLRLDEFNEMEMLSDGSFIVAARSIGVTNSSSRIVVKYDITGDEVWTFQVNNPVNSSPFTGFFGIAITNDGKIIASGKNIFEPILIRLNPDGSEDKTFQSPKDLPMDKLHDVVVQSDGKIVVNYSDGNYGRPGFFSLVRFNSDGSPDTGFGNEGIVETNVTEGVDIASKIILQPDGKILLGGHSRLNDPRRYFFTMVRYQGGNVVPQTPRFDYDGDGKSDISVYRPSNGVWYLNQSTNGFTAAQFGISTDRIVPADFDGDGRTDIAIYRDGFWWILQSSDSSVKVFQFGIAEDKPQSGDFDGDGKDDLAVFRPSTGIWYVLRSSDNGFYGIQFGLSEDIPQSADYDGDGKEDIAVFRPSSGTWYVQKSLGGTLTLKFGSDGDIPSANDYDGDGNADLTIWRPSSGDWYILKSSSNQVDRINFGLDGDIPVAADYDGDGKVDIAVWRPSNGVWYQLLSTNGWNEQLFGLSNDQPTPNAYNP